MKMAVFLKFNEERKESIKNLLEETNYQSVFLDSTEELFENIFNNNKKYLSVFIPDDIAEINGIILEIKTHLKLSLNIIKYKNEDLSEFEIDNFISETAPKEEYLSLLRGSKKITELLDTSIDISNNFYHFEFFKRIIHIEIKRAKRYGIELSLLYLTFNNADQINNNSKEQFESLFREFNAAITKSIRDIDIPIAFGEEAILLMMPHTNKGGANIVAERIYNKLTKNAQSINFSISIVSPKKEDLNFSIMMRMIHEGIEESVKKGGKSIIINK